MHHHPITKPIQIQKPRLHRMSAPFPMLNNVAAPDPPPFFAQNLLARPLPTNSAWQNFVLKNGDQPEFIHPYLVQSARGALTICYPARVVHPAFIFQAFVANLIVSCASSGTHTITRFDDLSVTLKLPGPLTAPLVRGSPYITLIVEGGELKFSTIHAVLDVSASDHCTKHKILFNNGQTWVVYSSAPLKLNPDLTVSDPFQGILRIAALSDKFDQVAEADQKEHVLDRFRTSYPVSGHVELHTPFRVCYKWKKKGWGDLLMLSHSVHRQILSLPGTDKVYPEFRYRSMDGDLVGIAGDSWVLEETPISISWYSVNGFQSQEEIQSVISALEQDVAELSPINTSSTYFYGKAIARAARLALIAEETHSLSLIPRVRDYLEDSITPWLDGSFQGNGFGYDNKWGGLISQDGSRDSGADFGLGVYNDHHYHFGYFCYAIAVLAKLDHNWARRFKSQVYAIVEDFMSLEEGVMYPRLRNFDLWKLHSWASGITEFADGRNQESTSEALNAYYSAALLGLVYGDANLIGIGSTLAALEIRSAKAWWHVPLNSTVYESEFVEQNRVMGVLWANKRDSGLWFAPAEWRECRLGIQLLPILPITELLFSDVGFVKELVEWTVPALGREGVGEGWKGFVYALESMYDKDGALQKVKTLKGYDDGNSLSNLLWWICTRGNDNSVY